MGGINTGRWLAGGVVAGIIVWLFEGAASMFYMGDMEAALGAMGLSMDMTPTNWALTAVVSLITGLALVFFYAAARPRFGPGPQTAAIVAVGLWASGLLVSVLGYQMIGMYPGRMLVTWAVIGLVEFTIAGMVGGWIYREGTAG